MIEIILESTLALTFSAMLILRPMACARFVGNIYWHMSKFTALGKTEESKKYFFCEETLLVPNSWFHFSYFFHRLSFRKNKRHVANSCGPNHSLQSDGAKASFRFSLLSTEGQNISQAPAPPLSSTVRLISMNEKYVELDVSFSTADTIGNAEIFFKGRHLELKFWQWDGAETDITFDDVIGFRWDDNFLSRVKVPPDRVYEIENSDWKNELHEGISINVEKYHHYRLYFISESKALDVIAGSMEK